MKFLISGGAGFIGSALIRQLICETSPTIINVDALTYAGNLESLDSARHDPRHLFEHVNITDLSVLERVFREHQPDAAIHPADFTKGRCCPR